MIIFSRSTQASASLITHSSMRKGRRRIEMEALICQCSQMGGGTLRMLDAWKRRNTESWRKKGQDSCRGLFVIAKRVPKRRVGLLCTVVLVVVIGGVLASPNSYRAGVTGVALGWQNGTKIRIELEYSTTARNRYAYFVDLRRDFFVDSTCRL
jgi:hypothetical protein